MSSSGHIFDMISRLRFNLEQKNARRFKRERLRELYYKKPLQTNVSNKGKFTENEKQQFISKSTAVTRRENRKRWMLNVVIFTLVFVPIAVYFFLMLFESFKK